MRYGVGEMEYLEVKNWEKFQHYTKRDPPWIKLYYSTLDDYEYACLQDASKLLLISLWMLAGRTNNKIPCDTVWIKSKSMIKGKINLDPLVSAGFITVNGDASKMLANCKQDATLRREEKRREETEYTDRFNQFWKAYPKKQGKGEAWEAWRKVEKIKIILDDILNAVKKQKKSRQWQKDDGQYIPNPATWLNQRRWEDELDTPEVYEGGLQMVCRVCKEPKSPLIDNVCVSCRDRVVEKQVEELR